MPLDVEKAAKDWPDLNFIIYHSGYRGLGAIGRGTGDKVEDKKTDDPQEIYWISDLLRAIKRSNLKNVYFELGSHVQHDLRGQPHRLPAHARADDAGRRRGPHPLGHRLDLERLAAKPDRANAPAEDAGRTDGRSTATRT